MENKKGFTIIELLTVILIISILLIIAVPTVMKYMKKGTESYYRSIENELKVSGGEYVETYRTLLPQNVGHVRVIVSIVIVALLATITLLIIDFYNHDNKIPVLKISLNNITLNEIITHSKEIKYDNNTL